MLMTSLQKNYGWAQALGLSLLVAELSYRWIEKPILAWRDRDVTDGT